MLVFADSPADVVLEWDRRLAKENSTKPAYVPDARDAVKEANSDSSYWQTDIPSFHLFGSRSWRRP